MLKGTLMIGVMLGLVSCAQLSSEKPRYVVNTARYEKLKTGEGEVKISLWDQQAWLIDQHGEVVLKTDVSTGVSGHETPAQAYRVIDKAVDKSSNIYGRYVDKVSGKVVQPKAWLHVGPVPENWRWEGIEMPYWMRLTNCGIGMHVGAFPRRKKCSFGCIRVHDQAQPLIYKKMQVGSKLTVVEESLVEKMAQKENFSTRQRILWGK